MVTVDKKYKQYSKIGCRMRLVQPMPQGAKEG